MLRMIVISLFWLATSTSHAEGYGYVCSKLANQLGDPEANRIAPLDVVITQNGILQIYGAPNVNCKMKKVPVTKNDVLTVYQSYGSWINIKYIDKQGNDSMGLVLEDRMNKMVNMASIPNSVLKQGPPQHAP